VRRPERRRPAVAEPLKRAFRLASSRRQLVAGFAVLLLVAGMSVAVADPFASASPATNGVTDNAAGEACPVWPGQPMTAHWGIEDPAVVEGIDIAKERAFAQAFRYLKNRITLFIALPIRSLDTLSLANRLKEIGRMEGASRGGKVGA